jgi:hypothetical protein
MRPVIAASLVALGILAIGAPARAQERVTRPDYGFTYVIPRGYRPNPNMARTGLGDSPIALVIREGTQTQTIRETNTGYTNLSILSSIRLVLLPASQRIIAGGSQTGQEQSTPQIDEAAARRLVEVLNSLTRPSGTTLDYQKSALIKISGEDALVVRCNGFTRQLNTEFTARLVLLPHGEKLYMFLFGALNSEFEEKVGAFNSFMNSFKFLKPPGAKPAPKKPKA